MVDGICQYCYYPYLTISTAEELRQISLDGKYILLNNIDLGGIEWTPIGTYANPFTGIFNGNGYEISNFKITTDVQYIGLFGCNTGTIQKLGVKNYTIKVVSSCEDSIAAGGLVGYNNRGIIEKCYTTGTVNVTHNITGYISDVGGLVGNNYDGTITESYATGNVTAKAWRADTGGLVGDSYGLISNCFATGNVNNTRNLYPASGGLVGYGGDSVINCYALGDVISILQRTTSHDGYGSCSWAGGLIGYYTGGKNIKYCYATGNIQSTSYASEDSSYGGGLIGDSGSSYIYGWYRYSGQKITLSAKNYTYEHNSGTTATDMATLKSISFHTNTLGWDSTTWNFIEGQHPTLKNTN